jgi:hypothetical protein
MRLLPLLSATLAFVPFTIGATYVLGILCVFTGAQLWACWGGLILVVFVVPFTGLAMGWRLWGRGRKRGALVAGSATLLYYLIIVTLGIIL